MLPVRACTWLVLLLLLSAPAATAREGNGGAFRARDAVRIGVLAKRGVEYCRQRWDPTASYLSRVVPGYRFEVVPLPFEDVAPAVAQGGVDFILSNPSFYVELEVTYGVYRIATIKNRRPGGVYTTFGGLIFCRADREDIRDLDDLRGKRFMAVQETSLGGWRMAWLELKHHGIDPYHDFSSLMFGNTHDAVVRAVAEGRVDAGTVRTDTIERMAQEGRADPAMFRILNDQSAEDPAIPFPVSTALYPEWPLAALAHTPRSLSETVLRALLAMRADDPAAVAAHISGWTIPLSYQPVHDALRELKVGPYGETGRITLRQVLETYWPWLLPLSLLLLAGAVTANVVIVAAKRKLEHQTREITRNEAFLSDILEAIQNGIYVINPDFTIRRANSVVSQWFGCGRDIEGGLCHRIFYQREEPCDPCPMLRCLESGRTEMELRAHEDQGGTRWLELYSYPMREGPGEHITGVVIFSRDVSERKRALNALEHELHVNRMLTVVSQKFFALTDDLRALCRVALDKALELSHSPQGLLVAHDPDSGMDVFMVHADGSLDGQGRPRMSIRSIDPETGRGRTLHIDLPREAHFSNQPCLAAGQGPACSNHPKLERFMAVPLYYGSMLLGHLLLANSSRPYDENMLTAVSRLADLCSLTMNAYYARQERERLMLSLRQAQKMEALGTLAGGIAHDFNNMLTPIMGYAEMILYARPNDQALHEDMTNIVKAARRARDLVQQILAFSRRKEQGQVVMHVQPILKEALKLLAASLPATITLNKEIDPDCGPVLADPSRLHQVVMNLCTNAYQAIGERDGAITVRLDEVRVPQDTGELEHSLRQGLYVRISVRDTGVGMSAAVRERIFEPYFTTKEKTKGTGLGLAVVHGIVKGAGGTVRVESEPGRGSLFEVFLPRVHQGEPGILDGGDRKQLPRGSGRVLLVDDEEQVIQVVHDLVAQLGYEVTRVTDSARALEIFTEDPHRFDVVITDQLMPRMSGMDLSVKLMALRPDIPIILMSGFSDLISREDVLSVGIRVFLHKPISAMDLACALRDVLAPESGA